MQRVVHGRERPHTFVLPLRSVVPAHVLSPVPIKDSLRPALVLAED